MTMMLYTLFHQECDEEGEWSTPYLVGVYSSKKNAKAHEKAISDIWHSERYNDREYKKYNKTRIEPYILDSSDERYLTLG